MDPVRGGGAQGTNLTALGNSKSNVIILLHENQLCKTSTLGRKNSKQIGIVTIEMCSFIIVAVLYRGSTRESFHVY